ncbi:MAG: class I SAM-dependent methyltransferase [Planctomycetaceae bacterium]
MSANELIDLNLSAFRPGMTVLDVGCGYGRELQRLADAGCLPIGIDPFSECVEQSRSLGFTAHQGYAEHLPFADNSFDGVISQVVLPYTNDVRTLREIARVLKPGGRCILSTHGLGYYWLIMRQAEQWRRACYAIRSIVNTWFYRFTGFKLPRYLGDTIYQSPGQLKRIATRSGLDVIEENIAHRFWGMPVFMYYTFRKPVATAFGVEPCDPDAMIDDAPPVEERVPALVGG